MQAFGGDAKQGRLSKAGWDLAIRSYRESPSEHQLEDVIPVGAKLTKASQLCNFKEKLADSASRSQKLARLKCRLCCKFVVCSAWCWNRLHGTDD
mmetsp:Transcript_4611/g.13506  ORF Transcript_4611/g.13506 Transcript_4611/m.13506 type:complete len:95 (-) Transcript_4611:510-794(-)